MQFGDGTSVSGSYAYDGIGIVDFKSHSGELSVNIPLNAGGRPEGSTLQGSYSMKISTLLTNSISSDMDESHTVRLQLKIPF
jgi:hypothetical protein